MSACSSFIFKITVYIGHESTTSVPRTTFAGSRMWPSAKFSLFTHHQIILGELQDFPNLKPIHSRGSPFTVGWLPSCVSITHPYVDGHLLRHAFLWYKQDPPHITDRIASNTGPIAEFPRQRGPTGCRGPHPHPAGTNVARINTAMPWAYDVRRQIPASIPTTDTGTNQLKTGTYPRRTVFDTSRFYPLFATSLHTGCASNAMDMFGFFFEEGSDLIRMNLTLLISGCYHNMSVDMRWLYILSKAALVSTV